MSVWRQTGKKPAKLKGPELPSGAAYLWTWFIDLHSARGGGGFGPQPISYMEIDAWARLCCIRITAWEVETIKAMDSAYLKIAG